MGKSSEQFMEMRERDYLISATFEVNGRSVNTLENYLLENSKLINYKILPDTRELYDNDPVFRKLVKIESEAKKQKETYSNHKL